jgi:hypothetical protein
MEETSCQHENADRTAQSQKQTFVIASTGGALVALFEVIAAALASSAAAAVTRMSTTRLKLAVKATAKRASACSGSEARVEGGVDAWEADMSTGRGANMRSNRVRSWCRVGLPSSAVRQTRPCRIAVGKEQSNRIYYIHMTDSAKPNRTAAIARHDSGIC